MKIRITQTVNIDPAAWALEYGLERNEVRDDVKSYFENWLQEHVAELGLDAIEFEDNEQ